MFILQIYSCLQIHFAFGSNISITICQSRFCLLLYEYLYYTLQLWFYMSYYVKWSFIQVSLGIKFGWIWVFGAINCLLELFFTVMDSIISNRINFVTILYSLECGGWYGSLITELYIQNYLHWFPTHWGFRTELIEKHFSLELNI